MSNYLFVVEGYHDVAFLSEVLKLLGYKEIKKLSKINALKKLIPTNFPFSRNSLDIFNVIPIIFDSQENQIAIFNANGEKNIFRKIDDLLSALDTVDLKEISKILVFADGDLKNRQDKIEELISNFYDDEEFTFIRKKNLKENDSIIFVDELKFSIPLEFYIFPDNNSKGRLEEILLESISITHNELLVFSNEISNTIKQEYGKKYVDDFDWSDNNSHEDKFKISLVGSVFDPGASNAVHIRRRNWISSTTKDDVNAIRKLIDYLKEVLK